MSIHRIKESVQKISEAIAAALDCNVTIVDDQLMRIAGTGPYREEIQNYAPKGSAFTRVLKTKETVVIEEPGRDYLCQQCDRAGNCEETYEICCPITWEGTILGVIGIFAYNQAQKLYFQERKEDFLNFLGKMADLIASKVGEEILHENILTRNQELDAVIQHVNQGVVCITETGEISQINDKAKHLLGIHDSLDRMIGQRISDYWKGSILLRAIEKNMDYVDIEEYYEGQGYKKGLLTTVKLIHIEGQLKGAVATFSDFDTIQKSAYRLREKNHGFTFDSLLGVSPQLIKVKKKAMKVAKNDSTVLITGDSGTGKEIFARAIHNASHRHDQPFVSVNCSAIPETLLESELFGYEPGAFTGASKKGKTGKIELAHRGTFFLDEIGDMPLYLQAKLLRVLQDRKVTKIGGLEPIELDVRIVSATNKNLEELIEKKMFREDLYYRLNVIPLILPSLRDRKDDIAVLTEHFLALNNERFDKAIKGFSKEAMAYMREYAWPGNVRELENIVEYGINFAEGETIELEDIIDRFRKIGPHSNQSLKTLMHEFEKQTIERCLDQYGWTEEGKAKAAEQLGISRATLYRKISHN